MITRAFNKHLQALAGYSGKITGGTYSDKDDIDLQRQAADITDDYQHDELTRAEYEAINRAYFVLRDAGRDALKPGANIYTMDEWKADKRFKAVPGQEITAEVYEEMLNCVPPKSIPKDKARQALQDYDIPVHAGFLMGEPYCSDSRGVLYRAFGMNDYGKGKHYYYLGLSRPYKTLNGSYYYFDCMNAFVNDGLFPAAEFEDDQEAIRKAADYEATLYKYEYRDGDRISTTVLYEPMFL